MIIATAGHVDHGKTALIKALTGQDTDRTAEEQRRGMSIELGYAYWVTPSGISIDFVDVPGHARFMRTLIAGVGAVGAAMLVVAADEGVMPQTIEHLRLLHLLNIQPIIPVITRCSRADHLSQMQVRNDVLDLLREHCLPATEAHLVDSLDGFGIDSLRQALNDLAKEIAPPAYDQLPRFIIDRHFKQPGAGDVVTGTLIQGAIHTGDSLHLSSTGEAVKVRSLQVHHQSTDSAKAGQRCAISLGSTGLTTLVRGTQLLPSTLHRPTARLDARLHLSAEQYPRNLQLHLLGTVSNARLVPLKSPDPQQNHYTQCVLEQAICCRHGDRFVLRDPASQALIGGGTVIDPYAPDKGRHRPARLLMLGVLDQQEPLDALQGLLNELEQGVDLELFALTHHLPMKLVEDWLSLIAKSAPLARKGSWATTEARQRQLEASMLERVQAYHLAHPIRRGMPLTELALETRQPFASVAFQFSLRNCLNRKDLYQSGHFLHMADFQPELSDADEHWLRTLLPHFDACSPRPPILGDLMTELAIDREGLLSALQGLVHHGALIFVGRNRYLLPRDVDRLYQVALGIAKTSEAGSIDTALFRDQTGIGRNHSVAVLEYFDRVRLTRSTGSQRAPLISS